MEIAIADLVHTEADEVAIVIIVVVVLTLVVAVVIIAVVTLTLVIVRVEIGPGIIVLADLPALIVPALTIVVVVVAEVPAVVRRKAVALATDVAAFVLMLPLRFFLVVVIVRSLPTVGLGLWPHVKFELVLRLKS